VGKSSLVQQFASNSFDPSIESTRRISSTEKVVEIDGKRMTLGIWDTAGQPKYRSLGPIYYQGCYAAIVVYDITRRNTFDTIRYWVKELKEHGGRSLAIGICGNKSDLANERAVFYEEGEAVATELGALFAETSSKFNDGHIDSLFINTTKQGLANKMGYKGSANKMGYKGLATRESSTTDGGWHGQPTALAGGIGHDLGRIDERCCNCVIL